MTQAAAGDERGQILILTALSMTVLLGIAALSIDASFMYDKRNRLYAAADAAAKSGATEVHLGNSANMLAFAQQQVVSHGFALANVMLTVRLCNAAGATCTAPYNTGDFVEALLSEVTSTFFGRVLGFASLTPGARAVAGIIASPNCLITVGAGPSGIFLSGTGGPITGNNCDVADGGDYVPNGRVFAHSVAVTGACSGCTGVPAPPPLDPLATLPVPTAADCNAGAPGSDLTVTPPITLPPGTYHDITFDGGTLTLQPGVYCITGNITANPGKNVSWNDSGGVTIYLGPMARLNLNSDQVDIRLEARTAGVAGVYAGIIFYQDRDNLTDVVLGTDTGTGMLTVEGVFYFPSASVDFKNVSFSASNLCGIVVARSVQMANASMELDKTCGSFGGSPILTVALAE